MSLVEILINLLFAFLGFFLTRWIGSMVVPEGQDRDRVVTIVAILVAIIVFFANFAARLSV